MRSLIAVISVGVLYLFMLHLRNGIIMNTQDIDMLRSVFWMTAVGSAVGILIGGLLVFLCFRPFITFADSIRKEMEERDSNDNKK